MRSNKRRKQTRMQLFIIIACIILSILLILLIKDMSSPEKPTENVPTSPTAVSPAGITGVSAPTDVPGQTELPTDIPDPTEAPVLSPTPTSTPTPSPYILPEDMTSEANIRWSDSDRYVYFGSYPQTEVTGADLTSSIINAEYDYNQETIVNGVRYQRLSKDNINFCYYDDEHTTLVKNYYDWTAGGYHYFRYEPIKWRVIERSSTEVLLLAEDALDCRSYHEEDTPVTWQTSTLRSWLNGYNALENDCEIDYSWRSSNFFTLAFTKQEQALLNYFRTTEGKNPEYPESDSGEITADKVFLFSLNDMTNPDYGFSEDYTDYDTTRVVFSSTYAKARGLYSYYAVNSICHGSPSWYWLRTPGMTQNYAAVVCNISFAMTNGLGVSNREAAVRPAILLSLTGENNDADFETKSSDVPVISGVRNRTVEAGTPIAYKKGVTATDAQDGTLTLLVESSTVNYRVPGEYTVTYSATDRDGNTTSKKAVFTVTNPINLEERVAEQIEQVLSTITKPSMTKREKAYEIFKYVRDHVEYIGTSNKDDSLQDAYIGLKNGFGDCYTTFNVAQRLLEAVGIETRGLERLRRNNDSRHYWLLVNCGDGWYFFDAGYFAADYPFDGFMFTETERKAYCDLRGRNGFYYRYDTALCDVTPVK